MADRSDEARGAKGPPGLDRSTLCAVSARGGDQAVLRRRARLEPELGSARAARRLLRDALAAAGVSGNAAWTDSAELAVHELVANAVLHANTPIEISVEPHRDRVRVEVRDFEPSLPAARYYDAQATTGRGMGLVAALTDECGAQSLGVGGKMVWFEVGSDTAGHGHGDAVWDVDTSRYVDAGPTTERVLVRLLSTPIRLWLAARQHHDALLRELALYLVERDPGLVDLGQVHRVRGTVSRVVAHVAESHDKVSGPGWESTAADLEIDLPRELGPAYVGLRHALDVAERLAGSGELLARPGLPEIVAVRDWVCEQIATQLAGATPVPWGGTARELFETAVRPADQASGIPADVLGLGTSTRAVAAADAANRIVAVSPPLAALVGWDAAELVGRRVVTLVPPELREAHVAAFSRYLSSGEARILGRPLEVPVLCRDGSRVPCRLLIEQAPGAGEALFVAWFDPLPGPVSGPVSGPQSGGARGGW